MKTVAALIAALAVPLIVSTPPLNTANVGDALMPKPLVVFRKIGRSIC